MLLVNSYLFLRHVFAPKSSVFMYWWQSVILCDRLVRMAILSSLAFSEKNVIINVLIFTEKLALLAKIIS